MWQAVGDAARSAGRFARRHRRAIVVGGVIGAAACAYHRMIKALEEVTIYSTVYIILIVDFDTTTAAVPDKQEHSS